MKVKLNLGCGWELLDGYINCDLRENLKADKHFDLNEFPYPFADNSADVILLSHVLEHLDDPVQVLQECHRVLKTGGELRVYVPYFSSESAYADIDHKHFFGITTFNPMDQDEPNHYKTPFCNLVNFKIKKRRLRWRHNLIFKPFEWFFNLNYTIMRIYQEFLCWIIPAKAVDFYFIKAEKLHTQPEESG
jgi:SAM-dependent methyltransferase